MQCERCGSERVNYERDATLIARALGVEGNTLILDSDPVPESHDDVHLCCFDCGQQQRGMDWEEERPQHAPADGIVMHADEALDKIAAKVNEPGECNGGDLVEVVSQLLPHTGRAVEDSE